MKRITAAFVLLVMFATSGCTTRDEFPEITTSVTTTVPATEVVTESGNVTDVPDDTVTSASTEDPDENKAGVTTESFTSGECYVTLMYPVYGDGKHDVFDIAMRNHAMQMFKNQGLFPEDDAVYEITKCMVEFESEYFVSAVMIGHIINPTAPHDANFAYTVNADVQSGKIYLSEELVGNLEDIRNAVHQGKFTQSYGIDGLANAISDGTVAYDDITRSWRSDYGVFPQFYFTPDNFGVMAELPHAIGSYAGFEIPYTEAGNMINPVAKGLCGIMVTTD